MIAIIFLMVTALVSTVTIIIKKQKSAVDILETVTLYMILVNVGLGGLYAFTGHTLMADRVAARIGWEPGSPFQLEVAAANLAFGILGVCSAWFRGNFWLATAVGYAVFLLGAACVHVREIILKGNYAEYNAGAFLFIRGYFHTPRPDCSRRCPPESAAEEKTQPGNLTVMAVPPSTTVVMVPLIWLTRLCMSMEPMVLDSPASDTALYADPVVFQSKQYHAVITQEGKCRRAISPAGKGVAESV